MFGLPAIRAAVLPIMLSRRSIGSGALEIRVRTLFARLGCLVPLLRMVVARLSIVIARFGRTVSLPSDLALVRGRRLLGVITRLNHIAIIAELPLAIGLSGPRPVKFDPESMPRRVDSGQSPTMRCSRRLTLQNMYNYPHGYSYI
jgi:hypothetical protein